MEEVVSFKELKSLATKYLPKDSILRNILSYEPDYLPKTIASGKVEIYISLLYEELKQY
jgi:hypothetical protein